MTVENFTRTEARRSPSCKTNYRNGKTAIDNIVLEIATPIIYTSHSKIH
jgi:hypothetical protein